jgi:hypothetical protein
VSCVCRSCRYKIDYCKELGIPVKKVKLKLDKNGKPIENKKVEKS